MECSPRAKADADSRPSPSAARVSGVVVVGRGDTTSCALSPARFRQSASGVHATLSVVRRPRSARECFDVFFRHECCRRVSVSIDGGLRGVIFRNRQCRSCDIIISSSPTCRTKIVFVGYSLTPYPRTTI